jgi:hypothetical protein
LFLGCGPWDQSSDHRPQRSACGLSQHRGYSGLPASYGNDVVVAVVGAVAAIAMWLGFGWVVDRLFSEWF